MKILTGNSNINLALDISRRCSCSLTPVIIKRFPDDELSVMIVDNLQGHHVFIIQSTAHPVNENVMELLLMIDAVQREIPSRITVCLPYMGYARQDRKIRSGMPFSAQLIARLIEAAGAHQVLILDLHAPQIQGFFRIPSYNLSVESLWVQDIQKRWSIDARPIIVSPDFGGVKRAQSIARSLGTELICLEKMRYSGGSTHTFHIKDDLQGKDCILVDDIIDTGNTICQGAKILREAGAKNIDSYITHGLFSEGAIEKIKNSYLRTVTTTNSVQTILQEPYLPQIRFISVACLWSEAILRIKAGESLNRLEGLET